MTQACWFATAASVAGVKHRRQDAPNQGAVRYRTVPGEDRLIVVLCDGRFVHADDFFKAMARVDNSLDRTFRSFLNPDLLILDDLGLHRLTAQQSADLYELILNRHRSTSFVITSNRAVDEWLSLFDDPILGNSALDRLANASYQIIIEGTSYRERLSPHRALLGEGGD